MKKRSNIFLSKESSCHIEREKGVLNPIPKGPNNNGFVEDRNKKKAPSLGWADF